MAGTKSAGEVKVLLSVETTSYSAAIDKAKAKLNEMSGASQDMAKHTVSSAAAASGALRGIEGAIPIRAAEKFLSMLPGMGAALQAAFPIIGALAVAEVIARGANELANFAKKTRESGAQFQASFQSMVNSQRLSNDELAKSNIQLENSIAKLTGKHENVLAAQLIDARIEADHLADSAASAAKQIKALLEENKAGLLAQIMGSAPTAEVFGNINNFQDQKNQARQRYSDATHNGDKAGADKAQVDYKQLIDNEAAYYRDQLDFRTGLVKYDAQSNLVKASKGEAGAQTWKQLGIDQTRDVTALQGAQALNYGDRDALDLTSQHTKDVAGQKRADDAKAAAERAKQAATKAQDAQRKADQDHLRALQEEWDIQRSQIQIREGESKSNFEQRIRLAQSDFWGQHFQDFAPGTSEQKSVLEGRIKPLAEYNTTDSEGRDALAKMLSNNGQLSDVLKGTGSSEKDTQAKIKATEDQWAALAKLTDEQQQVHIAEQERGGEITALDAATQLATLHTIEYADAVAKLREEQQRVLNDPTLSPDGRKAKLTELDTQGQLLDSQRGVQTKQDADRVDEQTGMGAWKKSLQQYTTQTKDTAAQVRDIWSSTLNGINDQFVKMMTGQRTSWKSMFSGIAGDISKTFLQKAEGSLMSAQTHGGKPDGSASNPLYVKNVDGVASAGGGLTSIFGALGGDGANPSGGAGGFVSTALTMLAGFADGGDPPINVPSIVGEAGPELFVPKGAGTIIPNHMLGGGDTHIHLGVDARGAGDPAAVEAIVNRALSKHAPALIAASMHSQRESAARKPSSKR